SAQSVARAGDGAAELRREPIGEIACCPKAVDLATDARRLHPEAVAAEHPNRDRATLALHRQERPRRVRLYALGLAAEHGAYRGKGEALGAQGVGECRSKTCRSWATPASRLHARSQNV